MWLAQMMKMHLDNSKHLNWRFESMDNRSLSAKDVVVLNLLKQGMTPQCALFCQCAGLDPSEYFLPEMGLYEKKIVVPT